MSKPSGFCIERPDLRAQARQVLTTALLLAAAAALLRFARLGTWSMWSDEIATLRDAHNLSAVKTYPIGYALIGWFVGIFGDSELAARFIPALAGVISVPAIYLVGRRLFNERAGVIAGAMLALSSYHIFFSQFARYYTLVLLFGLGAMWFGYLAIEHNRRRHAAMAVTLLVLAVLTHWSALLLVPALALCALLRLRDGFSWHKSGWTLAILFGPMLLGLLAASPLLAGFLRQWCAGGGFSAARFALIWAKMADRVELPVMLCAAAGGWMLWRLRDPRLAWLGAYAAVPLALTALMVGFSEGGSRFALVALPPFLLLAGYLTAQFIELARDRARTVAWLLLVLTLASAGARDLFYFTTERGQRPRWKEATSYALTKAEPGTRMMAAAPEVFDYHARRMGYSLRAEPLVMPCENSPTASQNASAAPTKAGDSLPAYIITEQVSNMAPNAEQQRWLDAHATLEKRFPLAVRFLDYSVIVYRVQPDETR